MDAISKKLPAFFKVFLPTYSSERMLNRPLPKNIVLQRHSGSRWFVKVVGEGNKVYFQEGWQKFVRDNGVETGDFLVFSYDGDNKFDVTLLGRSLCEKEELLLNIGMAADEDFDADSDASNHDKEGEEVELPEDEAEVEEEIELLRDEDEGEDEEEFDDDDDGEEEEIELLEDEGEEEEEVKLVEDWDEGEEKEDFDVYTDHNEDNEEEEIDGYTGHEEEEEEEAETDVQMNHDDEDEEEEIDVYMEHDEEREEKEEEETDVHMDHDEEEEEEMMKSRKRKRNGPRTGEPSESHKKGNDFMAEKYIQTHNPYFVPKLRSSGLRYLHIPFYILQDFDINLTPKIRFQDPLGRTWKGEVLKWKDGRTRIKGWKAVCRWNNIKEEDHCICELPLGKNQTCDTIKVHIIKPSPVRCS